MNLLAPVSPGGWSTGAAASCRWRARARRYEGFQYLGLGSLALIATAAGLAARRPPQPAAAPARVWRAAGAGRAPC